MPVSQAVTNQFEAELHQGDHKTRRSTEGAHGGVLPSHTGLSPGADVFLDDWAEFNSEHRLGCLRGVLWSLVFEAALVFAAAVYWKLRLAR